jgi:hypothetical protein
LTNLTLTVDQLKLISNRNDSNIDRDRLQHSFEDILIDCSFNNIDCTHRDFTKYFDRNLGTCFEFNSGRDENSNIVELKRTMRAGSLYGLKLTLYGNFYEKLIAYNRYLGLIISVSNSSYLELKDGVEVRKA